MKLYRMLVLSRYVTSTIFKTSCTFLIIIYFITILIFSTKCNILVKMAMEFKREIVFEVHPDSRLRFRRERMQSNGTCDRACFKSG